MPTRTLYYEDSHCAAFRARVRSCREYKDGYAVVLDATAFYPEGGGQAGDTGTLDGVRVRDTRHVDGELVHICEAPLTVGAEVAGAIDYEARFVRMQQHSGEHILSGIVHRRYGYHNTGFHMNLERMQIDFDGAIPAEDLEAIEAEANAAVWQNIPLHIWTPSPEELPTVHYRTKRALPWPVRIVEVPGYDACACCGTHVAATGEIGLVKLFSAVPFRGGTRIEMACGKPALALLNRVYQQNRQVSQIFSAQIEQTGAAAKQVSEQLAAQKYKIVGLQRRIFAGIAAGAAGKGDVLCFARDLDAAGTRELSDALAEACGGVAAVFCEAESGFGYCLTARAGDLRPLGKAMNAALNGRGGGKPTFQQGSVRADPDEIRAFFVDYAEIGALSE